MFKKIFLVMATMAFSLIVLPGLASAKNEGIQISPITYKFEIAANSREVAEIRVTNNYEEEVNYKLETQNFKIVSEEGAPDFSTDTEYSESNSLADWIKFVTPTEGKIAADEQKIVSFTIDVPKNAEPGGHYAAIFASVSKTKSADANIGVGTRVGTLVLVTVPGDVVKSAEIVASDMPSVVWSGPIDLSAKVKNTGSVHYDAKTTITIKPLFGRETSIDAGTHTILPDNTRLFTANWDKKYPFGYYKVTIKSQDGYGRELVENDSFWALPLIIVLPTIIGIALIIWILSYIRKNFQVVSKKSNY